jgi:serine/threonine-protein kinase RsbW
MPAVAESLPQAMAFLHAAWAEAALPEEAAFPFELALEEVFLNVASHGARDAGHPPEVCITLHRSGSALELVVEDDGTAFDPLTLPDPDTGAALQERPIGGLGVFLVRKLMDDVTYAHTGTHNRLTMRKAIA